MKYIKRFLAWASNLSDDNVVDYVIIYPLAILVLWGVWYWAVKEVYDQTFSRTMTIINKGIQIYALVLLTRALNRWKR